MPKNDFQPGSSSLEDFFKFINARHDIWVRRFVLEEPKPWTEEPIFLDYKFTNVFRQLDTGTIALRRLLALQSWDYHPNWNVEEKRQNDQQLIWTLCWYRLFNLDIHAYHWIDKKRIPSLRDLLSYVQQRDNDGLKVFTSAHLTTSELARDKIDTYSDAVESAWNYRSEVLDAARTWNTLESVFEPLKKIKCVGPFVAYEIICDLRFTKILNNAADINSWANVGPGAKRGLERLGMTPVVSSMIALWGLRQDRCSSNVLNAPVPFELREIEHSLCEFDKYERVRTGVGRPRQRYKGRA